MKNTIVTFGEIMGRFAPAGFARFRQTLPGSMDLTFGGAESNVATSVALLGGKTRFVTALPNHAIAESCLTTLRGIGVDTSYILRPKVGRFGLYFLETGANQRPSNVIYDREGSAISLTPGEDYAWSEIFADACWFHVTGITAALSANAAEAAILAARLAREAGATVSCDLNFRKKLWNWEPGTGPRELAEKTMRRLLEFVDVVIANEEDAADVLSIHAADTDVHAGQVAHEKYPAVAREIQRQFPQVKQVAITLRESLSASHNNWGAMLLDTATDTVHFAPLRDGQYEPYQIKNIVDRVGGGDSFGAGLIFALTTPELQEPGRALSFAVAASCLAHSLPGDINYVTRAEVESLMGGSASGRVVR
jgi:2-dehydro-3-deoxygluconokinase